MQQMRLFGESPTHGYGAGTAIALVSGYCAFQVMTDTVFSVLTFRHPVPAVTGITTGNVALAGVTIPAGTIVYGVAAATVTSGAGQVFFEKMPTNT